MKSGKSSLLADDSCFLYGSETFVLRYGFPSAVLPVHTDTAISMLEPDVLLIKPSMNALSKRIVPLK